MKNGYNNAFATVVECPHATSFVNQETGEVEKISTWVKYHPEKYHGKMERCSICKQKRVLDLEGETVGYIQQASLFQE